MSISFLSAVSARWVRRRNRDRSRHPRARTITALTVGALLTASLTGAMTNGGASADATAVPVAPRVVPLPVSMTSGKAGDAFTLGSGARIVVNDASAVAVADRLAAILRPSTGYALPVSKAPAVAGDISLAVGDPGVPDAEGYRLDVTHSGVEIVAANGHGLFNGVQTLRQLFPIWVESRTERPAGWTIPGVKISDYPRYQYRGAMLDIGRHYEPPSVIKTYIDEIAAYKVNTLHLHLSDDQGFRIAIDGRPELTDIGGQYSGGTSKPQDGAENADPGGYWTQADYVDVVKYAASRFVTIVPEIDLPGHTNAIIMSYASDEAQAYKGGTIYDPSVNCSNKKPPVWNLSNQVNFSALCPDSPLTWKIVTDIIEQLSALTPGPYLHIGGDEVSPPLLSHDQYRDFVARTAKIVKVQGKTAMGWNEIGVAPFGSDPEMPQGVVQYWGVAPAGAGGDSARTAVQKGMKIVMSPANKTYLDMKYTPGTPIGTSWACVCDNDVFYDWEPSTLVPERTASGTTLPAVTDEHIIGVEAPIWTETLKNLSHIEFMAFPRLTAIAEIGWSPKPGSDHPDRSLASFKVREAAQGGRWQVKGQNFYPSAQVPWGLDLLAGDRTLSDRNEVSGALATLAAPGRALGELSATIEWGDGTSSKGGLTGVEATDRTANGLYTLSGDHTYRANGEYQAKVTVSVDGRDPVVAGFTVTASGVPACTTTITGARSGPLTVSSGVACLDRATISGPVTVKAGAGLYASRSRLTGPLTASGAVDVLMCDTTVSGPLSLAGGGRVWLGNRNGGCAPAKINGPVTVTGTTGQVTIDGGVVSGPLHLRDNKVSAAPIVAGNRIGGPLSCAGNSPMPSNDGRPNTVSGPKTGQCAEL
ncbi:beta-N-acetylhexosaminidase [Sphaerimonospora cavernae]|uniref:beta-N-acetylhexosaminidase n=1 Tax=Sphaerimonospora cavernae TaxID=1740611 RepID=A0ABV6U994_9ACTN